MNKEDQLGHSLFKQYVKDCVNVLEYMLETPAMPLLPKLPQQVTITGIGSSAGHARFLSTLINEYTPISAEFVALSKYLYPVSPPTTGSTLIVFSQGLCPNSLLALKQRHNYEHLVLFTSSSFENKNKKDFLSLLENEGATIIKIPVKEDGLLVRTVGPMAGYLAAIQFINTHWKEALPACPQAELLSAISLAAQHITPAVIGDMTESLEKGSLLLAHYPSSMYINNLAYKLSEGLFVPQPCIEDILSFSHGPFQEVFKTKKAVVILDNKKTSDLFPEVLKLLDASKTLYWRICSNLPEPFCIFEYEAALNHFVLQTLDFYQANQVNWPGKGLDSEMYKIDNPL